MPTQTKLSHITMTQQWWTLIVHIKQASIKQPLSPKLCWKSYAPKTYALMQVFNFASYGTGHAPPSTIALCVSPGCAADCELLRLMPSRMARRAVDGSGLSGWLACCTRPWAWGGRCNCLCLACSAYIRTSVLQPYKNSTNMYFIFTLFARAAPIYVEHRSHTPPFSELRKLHLLWFRHTI